MIGFIGVGNMAGALISGILNNKIYKETEITVYDSDASKYDKFNLSPSKSISELCIKSDLIFLCVKPQVYSVVLHEISQVDRQLLVEKTFVSIAAGISTSLICKKIGENLPVIRVMPNTPLLIAQGATALSHNEYVDKNVFDKVVEIFGSLGICKILQEDMMNRIISVNGSSPAYIYLLAKAMCDSAKKQGIEQDVLPLVIQTIIGSAKMMEQSGLSPDELIKMVASPNGTTLAALQSFENDNFVDIINRAMQSCTDRAEQIAQEAENN